MLLFLAEATLRQWESMVGLTPRYEAASFAEPPVCLKAINSVRAVPSRSARDWLLFAIVSSVSAE